MGGRAPPVEQAGRGEQKAPVHTDAVRLAAAEVAVIQSSRASSATACLRALAAGDDQRVERGGRITQGAVRRDREATGALDRPAITAERADLIATLAGGSPFVAGLDQLVGAGEDLERARHVEALHAGVEKDRDLARFRSASH